MVRDQQFSLYRWRASVSPAVIARSASDEAILRSGMNRIAASLPLLAMTTKDDGSGPVDQFGVTITGLVEPRFS
jgi:hypothetical protein